MLRKIRDIYRLFENGLLITMMLVSTLIVCYSVFMRYIIGNPVVWSEEIVCYLQVWIAFIGVSFVSRNQDDFIRFDFILHRLKPKTRAVINVLERLILFVFMSVLFVSSTRWLFRVYGFGGVSTPMKVPNWIPRIVIPFSFLLMSIHYIESLVEESKRCMAIFVEGGKPDER